MLTLGQLHVSLGLHLETDLVSAPIRFTLDHHPGRPGGAMNVRQKVDSHACSKPTDDDKPRSVSPAPRIAQV